MARPIIRRLRVYGGTLDGTARTIVFARSLKQVRDVLTVNCGFAPSLHYLREYWSETGNETELALCNRESVWKQDSPFSRTYTRVQREAARDMAAGEKE